MDLLKLEMTLRLVMYVADSRGSKKKPKTSVAISYAQQLVKIIKDEYLQDGKITDAGKALIQTTKARLEHGNTVNIALLNKTLKGLVDAPLGDIDDI